MVGIRKSKLQSYLTSIIGYAFTHGKPCRHANFRSVKTATTTCQATLKLFKNCLLKDHLSRVKKMAISRDPIEDTNDGMESEEDK